MFPEILPFASLIMTDNTTLKERMISISMEQFKKIDRKISLVSGVSKANAVLSALKGGLVDVLILDSNLAEALLKLTQE
jgi:DNA-binding transcriptional regulator LsrR (DeoR family)